MPLWRLMCAVQRDESMQRSSSIQDQRQAVAQVLDAVLLQTITPRQGLNRWPCLSGLDQSIDAAYMALMYLEADEDRHKAEWFYADVQLANLKTICDTLAQGQPLAEPVCRLYLKNQLQTGHWGEWGLLWQPITLFNQVLRYQWQFICRVLGIRK